MTEQTEIELTPIETVKPGPKTTEFKLTALTNVFTALLMALLAYGLLTAEEVEAWQAILGLVIGTAVPIATAVVNREYIIGRNVLKLEEMRNIAAAFEGLEPGAAAARPEAAE